MRSSRTVSYLLYLLFLIFNLIPAFYWKGGLLDYEAAAFIPQYLDDRGIVQKVFDPYANDNETYQARELSYFIDYLDAQAFRFLFAHGRLLLVPASALLAGLLTILVFCFGVRKTIPTLSPVTAGFILLLYLSNFIFISTMGVFYRSSKPLLTPLLLALMFYTIYTISASASQDVNRFKKVLTVPFFCVFALCCLMSLLDRQGFYYSAVAFVCFAAYYLLYKQRRDLVLGSFGAVCLMAIYNLLLARLIVNSVNDYWPSLDYQRISIATLISSPSYYLYSLRILAHSTAVLLGSFPAWVYLVIPLSVLLGKVWPILNSAMLGDAVSRFWGAVKRSFSNWSFIVVWIIVCSNILMFALMIIRHPPVYEYKDHWFFYYPLPVQVILIFGIAVAFGKLLPRLSRIQIATVNLLLLVIIVSNVSNWREDRNAMLESDWFPRIYNQSILLKRSFAKGKAEDQLKHRYLTFYDYCVEGFPPLKPDHEPRLTNETGTTN